MLLSSICDRIANVAPQFTTLFSTTYTVTEAEADEGVITVTTASAHGLTNGMPVSLASAKVSHSVTSITKSGTTVTVVLPTAHDLTENYIVDSIELQGVTETEYNTTHVFNSVPNRKTVEFEVPEAWDVPTGDSIKLIENRLTGLNGSYPATIIDATHFTIDVGDVNLSLPVVNSVLSAKHRVIGAVHIERFLEFYESKKLDTNWLVVCPSASSISKDRKLNFDAISAQGVGSGENRQFLTEPFSVYAILNTKDDMMAVNAVDAYMTEVRNALIGALCGYNFPTHLAVESSAATSFVGYEFIGYDKAYCIYEYRFETVKEITDDDSRFNDLAYQLPNVAFRDITLAVTNNFQETVITSDIDLDEEPLP